MVGRGTWGRIQYCHSDEIPVQWNPCLPIFLVYVAMRLAIEPWGSGEFVRVVKHETPLLSDSFLGHFHRLCSIFDHMLWNLHGQRPSQRFWEKNWLLERISQGSPSPKTLVSVHWMINKWGHVHTSLFFDSAHSSESNIVFRTGLWAHITRRWAKKRCPSSDISTTSLCVCGVCGVCMCVCACVHACVCVCVCVWITGIHWV